MAVGRQLVRREKKQHAMRELVSADADSVSGQQQHLHTRGASQTGAAAMAKDDEATQQQQPAGKRVRRKSRLASTRAGCWQATTAVTEDVQHTTRVCTTRHKTHARLVVTRFERISAVVRPALGCGSRIGPKYSLGPRMFTQADIRCTRSKIAFIMAGSILGSLDDPAVREFAPYSALRSIWWTRKREERGRGGVSTLTECARAMRRGATLAK